MPSLLASCCLHFMPPCSGMASVGQQHVMRCLCRAVHLSTAPDVACFWCLLHALLSGALLHRDGGLMMTCAIWLDQS